jgi:cytochrome c biogenesis protein CcdA
VIAAGVSAISVILGAALAFTASGHPRHREVIETVAGMLIIAGLALLGYALERVIGRR